MFFFLCRTGNVVIFLRKVHNMTTTSARIYRMCQEKNFTVVLGASVQYTDIFGRRQEGILVGCDEDDFGWSVQVKQNNNNIHYWIYVEQLDICPKQNNVE